MANGYIHIGTGGSINGERMLIMEPKHYFSRKFNCGEWNELRLLMVYAVTSDADYESYMTTLTGQDNTASFYDKLYLGLINGDLGDTFPGESGQYFAGMGARHASGMTWGGGTAVSNNSLAMSLMAVQDESWSYDTQNWDHYHSAVQLNYVYNMIKFERDTINEELTLTVPWIRYTLATATQPDESAMETQLDTFAAYGGTYYDETFSWPNSNPDLNAVFIYHPKTGARLRLHGFMVKKYS